MMQLTTKKNKRNKEQKIRKVEYRKKMKMRQIRVSKCIVYPEISVISFTSNSQIVLANMLVLHCIK